MIKKNDFSIFDCFDPNGNDKLSLFKGSDLLDLVVLIDDVYVSYRDTLGFNGNNTFGVEIEFYSKIKKSFELSLDSWILKDEPNIKNGLEVNSPVLVDDVNNWKNLKKICLEIEGSINEKCGGHVHVGTQVLGNNSLSWLNFIKLWSIYENIIYRFLCGEFLTFRRGIIYNAVPMADKFYNAYTNYKDSELSSLIKSLCDSRSQVINFNHVDIDSDFRFGNTIEFRGGMGTLDCVIWQNYINFYLSFIKYCKSDSFNHDIVDKRYSCVNDKFCNLRFYNEIYIEQALEFVDMIFDSNIDKIYFLRQYFKSFDISNGFIMAKQFTKRF